MPEETRKTVTALLLRWRQGDTAALDQRERRRETLMSVRKIVDRLAGCGSQAVERVAMTSPCIAALLGLSLAVTHSVQRGNENPDVVREVRAD